MKRLLFLAALSFLLLINTQVLSQAPNWNWAKQCGGHETVFGTHDQGNAIITDASGNSYITGCFYDTASFGNNTIISFGEQDIYLAKYDSAGNNIWAKRAGGKSNLYEYGSAITLDNLGNIYLTGMFHDTSYFEGDTLIDMGDESIFIAMYDTSGNLNWVRKAGKTHLGVSRGIGVDASGNYYIAGSFTQTAYLGLDTLVCLGTSDIFIAKYDASGNEIWAQRGGGLYNDQCTGFSFDTNNDIYITGIFELAANFGGLPIVGNNYGDIFTAKYDSDGNVIWAQGAGGAYGDFGTAVSHDSLGNCFVTGVFGGIAFFGNLSVTGPFNKGDIFIAKYDPAGNIVWVTSAGGYYADRPNGIITESNGNSYITGSFADTAHFGNFTLFEGMNLFVAKYDASGNVMWVQQSFGIGASGYGISLDGDGNPYVIGIFSDTVTFGATNLYSNGNIDIVVAKLDGSGFTGLNNALNNDIVQVYPNPATETLSILIDNNELSEIFLYDITARKILHREFIKSVTLDIETLANGIYVYEIKNNRGLIRNGKVVKE